MPRKRAFNPPKMLSTHCSERDKYGIPKVSESYTHGINHVIDTYSHPMEWDVWMQDHKRLREAVKIVKHAIWRLEFIESFLLPHKHLAKYIGSDAQASAGTLITASSDVTVEAELLALQNQSEASKALAMKVMDAASALFDHVVRHVPEPVPSQTTTSYGHALNGMETEPQVLLRIRNIESHCAFDDILGFMCSSWKDCETIRDLDDLNPQNGKLLEELQSHCENEQKSTKWISMTASFSWMLKHIINKYRMDKDMKAMLKHSARISMISTARMRRLGVVFDSAESLVARAGGTKHNAGQSDGPDSAYSEHYLAYGFIPTQCIIQTLTLAEFQKVCLERDIRPTEWFRTME